MRRAWRVQAVCCRRSMVASTPAMRQGAAESNPPVGGSSPSSGMRSACKAASPQLSRRSAGRGAEGRAASSAWTGREDRLARQSASSRASGSGSTRLRPGQEQAVAAAAAGRDVLAVLPTGGGKSAIYELAGLLRGGPTVVVSPLIALQDDQLAHLQAAGLSATVLNSAQSAGARAAALVEACGPDEFVFLSPEQLANDETREALRRARAGAVRRRRGAPRQPVGAGLPARLPAARRAGRRARRGRADRAHRDRGAAGAARDLPAARAARSRGRDRRLRPAAHRSRCPARRALLRTSSG